MDEKLIEVMVEAVKGAVDTPSPQGVNFYEYMTRTVLQAAHEAGWKLVQREPTEEMCQAATILKPTWDDDVSKAKWRAMWDAVGH